MLESTVTDYKSTVSSSDTNSSSAKYIVIYLCISTEAISTNRAVTRLVWQQKNSITKMLAG